MSAPIVLFGASVFGKPFEISIGFPYGKLYEKSSRIIETGPLAQGWQRLVFHF